MKTLCFGLLLAMCLPGSSPGAEAKLKFASDGANGFTFNTGVLQGKLHADGKSKGLSDVVHLPTGQRLDASMGLFSHYRLFSANQRYGTAGWDLPSEAALRPDGSVEVRWSAAADRPFELRAVYRWAAAACLDLETTVTARANLPRFESFLASYFTPAFTNAQVYAQPAGGKAAFVPADPGAGAWIAFPRDDEAVAIIRDGRWQINPNPVDWVIMPRLAKPLGFRRAPASGVTAVLMAAPDDCFGLLTPQQTDPHDSLYLSLFGRDLKAGEAARARSRLVILPNAAGAEDIQAAYQGFLTGLSHR